MGPKCSYGMQNVSVDASWSYPLVNCVPTWGCCPMKHPAFISPLCILYLSFPLKSSFLLNTQETRRSPAPEHSFTDDHYKELPRPMEVPPLQQSLSFIMLLFAVKTGKTNRKKNISGLSKQEI